jgi:hypothetical protein
MQINLVGQKAKKYKYKPLNELIQTISTKILPEQHIYYCEQNFNSWKGDLEQVDDVCIVGIKI